MKKIFQYLLIPVYLVIVILIGVGFVKLISPYSDTLSNPLYGIWFFGILAFFILYSTYKKRGAKPEKLLPRTVSLVVAGAITSAFVYALVYNNSPSNLYSNNLMLILTIMAWGVVIIYHKGYNTKT